MNDTDDIANAIVNQTFALGSANSFTFASNVFTDVDAGTTLTYTATDVPADITFDGATRTFSGSPTAAGSSTITVTATDGGGLSVSGTFVLTSVVAPLLSTTVDGVTNLDVRSSIVFNVTESVTAVAGKNFILTNTGGTGFRGEATANSITIAADDTTQVTITGTGADTKIIVNPTGWDFDLANNYSLAVDTGAFLGSTSGQANVAFSTVNFSTVTPGANIGSATASQIYYTSTDAALGGAPTNELGASLSWFDASNTGDPSSGSGNGLALDANSANYAAVVKGTSLTGGVNTSTEYEGQGNIAFTSWDANDLFYVDGQDGTAADDQASLSSNLFSSGFGTAASPLVMIAEGTGQLGVYFVTFALDPAVTLPPLTPNSLLPVVISNDWSNTNMVIAG